MMVADNLLISQLNAFVKYSFKCISKHYGQTLLFFYISENEKPHTQKKNNDKNKNNKTNTQKQTKKQTKNESFLYFSVSCHLHLTTV